MADGAPTLFLVCGKIAAGKSTLAGKLAARPGTVCVSEDRWLAALFPNEIASLDDYVRCAARLRAAIGPHVTALLEEGLSVALDFPANTRRQRLWLRGLFEAARVPHELHFLDVPDDVCKRRLQDRNRSGRHAFQPTEADFDLVTSFFAPPDADEGFNLIVHRT